MSDIILMPYLALQFALDSMSSAFPDKLQLSNCKNLKLFAAITWEGFEWKMRGKTSKRNPNTSCGELSDLLVGTITTKASFWEGVSDINLSKKVSTGQ